MKVSVITRHAVTNYGSLLQAMATQLVIEKIGYESEIVDYIRDDESYLKHEITLLKRKRNWYNNPIKRWIYLMLRQPESILAGRRFEKERTQLLHMTKRYSSVNQLKNDPPTGSVYMTGSDQVWGPMEDGNYDSTYCLSFASENIRKVAYASSFGHAELSGEKKDFFRKWLSRYYQIAVREDSALEILKELHIVAQQVLDPTLLLTKDEWNEYVSEIFIDKYVLVYQIHNDKKLGQYAEQVAKAKGLPLIRVSTAFHQITRPGKLMWCPSIPQFLAFVKNADCMITDSFHGTAFAINFNVPFVEILPNNNTGTRNTSILNLTGLSDRILKNVNDIELAMQEIDFTKVNRILHVEREKSIEILKNMIEDQTK